MPKGHYTHKKRGTKQEEILAAATRVYAYYGFEGATLQKMADEAGVTRSLILKYFGSKQGLVRAVADRAVEKAMARLAEIDTMPTGAPPLSLRARAQKHLAYLQPAREDWCLILGTLLVPSFQFSMRGTLIGYFETEYNTNLAHMHEFINPTPAAVYAYTYADISMRLGFITSGNAESYRTALAAHQNAWLLPE